MAVMKKCTVVPAEPTPNRRLSLSAFDQQKVWSLSPLLFVFKPPNLISTANLTHTLTSSLARLLIPYYPLAGRLHSIGGGRFQILCNAMGADFVFANSDSNLDEFTDFDPTPRITHLLPHLDYTSPIETLPIVSVLLTKFACGGFTIGFAISHIIADAVSYINFINSWAKLARGEDLAESDLPCYDLFKLAPNHSPKFDHAEYKPLPFVIGRRDCEEEAAKDTSVAMLKLTVAHIKKLKKKANEVTVRPAFTTFEAVMAHTWRCACKARRGDARQPTVARVVINCRRKLKPPLPSGYAGNAVLTAITDPKCVFGDITAKPVSHAAAKIREAKERMDDEYIRSALSFIETQEDVSWMRNSFYVVGSRAGQYLGNPNISVTSWINVPFHEVDFGWGKPVHVGPAVMNTDGKGYIVPSCDGDGSLVMALRLQTEHMDRFKMFFYGDIDDHVSSKL